MMMGACSNLRERVGNRPPLVVFTASIAVFAIALVGVSLYLQGHRTQILNPDIKDWNHFFTTLSGMELCFPGKDSSEDIELASEGEMHEDTTTTTLLPEVNTTEVETNITLSLLADVQVTRAGKIIYGAILHSSLPARHLGFRRDPSVLDVTIELAPKSVKNLTACMLLSGPAHLLPDSSIMPSNCTITKGLSQPVEVELGHPWLLQEPEDWCRQGVAGSLLVAPQHELNVYLSEGDVTLIQIHILYTTCLLCIMMLFLLFYLSCGKRWAVKSKIIHSSDKVPLHP